jgi:hypothetical protein
MPLFCRHNRLTQNCPICSREAEAERRAATPARAPRGRAGAGTSGPPTRRRTVVTKRLARATDDGYRSLLAPGLRATADAHRLAAALGVAEARLEAPGPYPAVAHEPDLDEAAWLAFLLALVGPDAPKVQEAVVATRPSWSSGEIPDLPGAERRTLAAYRGWVERAGSQEAAYSGDPAWTPERRFGRVFERLALPGLGRAQRFELLAALGAAGRFELVADALHVGHEDDGTTLAAKRLLVSGDRMLLERRAADLARACGVSVAALDRGLALWGRGDEPEAEAPPAALAALGLR